MPPPLRRALAALLLLPLPLGLLPLPLGAQEASVDLGASDVESGLRNTQRGDATDGENDALRCGPAADRRGARRNRGAADDDFADHYLYFLVTAPAVKGARQLRIQAAFYDDPVFAGDPAAVRLHYTNTASQGPSDIPNTFAAHPFTCTLSGGGQWVLCSWTVTDAGFRTFMQGTSDFRFDLGPRRACLDRVEVLAVPEPEPAREHLIGAHYYPWYTRSRWDYRDCATGALRRELVPSQAPFLGLYDSSDPAVVDQHLRWCAEYGVNVVLLEFIQPGGREDDICRRVIFPHPRASDVRFAVLYDWAIRFGGNLEITPERIATAASDFTHLAREYFSQPSYLKVEGGRPLAMVYVTRALSGDIEGLIGALRDAVSAEGFDPFLVGDEFFFPSAPQAAKIARWDGIFGYDAYAGRDGYWGTNGTLALYRQRTSEYEAAARAAGVKFFPSCAAGFNDRAVRRVCASNPALPRQVAATDSFVSLFRETFVETALRHLDPEVPLVSITSFNEWHEDTQIEPTAGTGGVTTRDTSGGDSYTQGFAYDDYGLAFLEVVRDATLAVTGRILSPGGPVPFALIEVLEGEDVVLRRRSFSTGAYTVPVLALETGRSYRLRVSAPGFAAVLSPLFTVLAGRARTGFDVKLGRELPRFVRGDLNGDRATDLADAVTVLRHLFGGLAVSCEASGDIDDSGGLEVTDAVLLLRFLFRGAGPPEEPYPACGSDPTPAGTSCGSHPACP